MFGDHATKLHSRHWPLHPSCYYFLCPFDVRQYSFHSLLFPSTPQTPASMKPIGIIGLVAAAVAIGVGAGIGCGYAIWGRNKYEDDKWVDLVADAPKTVVADAPKTDVTTFTLSDNEFTIVWDEMQSYKYKNLLLNKSLVYDRDPPDWNQTSLISGASRNEVAATLSRAALMVDDAFNTAQLPYKFNFTLIRPVFVGYEEVFVAKVEYNNATNNQCGDAKVTGVGTVNGTVHTLSTIFYKCMYGQAERLLEKGYDLRRRSEL